MNTLQIGLFCFLLPGPLAGQGTQLGQEQGMANVDTARGKSILRRAQEAMGGVKELASVKDATHTLEIMLEPSAGGFKIKQVSLYLAPQWIRQEQEMPFGKMTFYSDAKSGWIATPDGVRPMPANILKQAKGVIFRQPVTLMLSDRDSSRTVKAVGKNAVEISTADGETVLIEFDSSTGLPALQSYTETDANGAPMTFPPGFALSLCANVRETLTPFEFSVEGGEV